MYIVPAIATLEHCRSCCPLETFLLILYHHLGPTDAEATTAPADVRLPTLLRAASQVVNVFLDRAIALPFEQFERLFVSR